MEESDKNKHIKSGKELKKYIDTLKLSSKEKKDFFKLTKPETLKPSGMSKKERNKLLEKADKENIIDHEDAYRIKKYGR